jgi:transposase
MEIKRLNEELKEDQAVVIAAQAAQRRKIERLDLVTATKLLEDLRAVLNEDVAIAGPAIRELTGPIRVRPEPIKESKGRSRWIATFTPQVAVLLGKLCPSECGQFAAGSLPEATPVEVVLAQVPLYQKLAKEFQRLRTEGLSAKEIAAQCGVGHKTLMDGLHFAHTGEERGSRPKSQRNRMRYKNLAPEVVRLIEEKDMQVKDVAVKLRVDESVVRRAYDHMRPDTPQKIIGGRLCRQRKSKRLPKRVFDTIRSLTAKGKNIKQIAKAAGCCETTVLREQKRLTKQRCAEAARKTA